MIKHLHVIVLIIYGVKSVSAEKIVQCNRLVEYIDESVSAGKWTAIYKIINANTTLEGVWVRVELDGIVRVLMNNLGKTVTTNNKDYTIKSARKMLKSDESVKLSISVRFQPETTPPRIKALYFNGLLECQSASKKSSDKNLLNDDSGGSTKLKQSLRLNVDLPRFPEAPPRKDSSAPAVPPPPLFRGDLFWVHDDSDDEEDDLLPNSVVDCGTRADKPISLITHGTISKEGDWPWHAALYKIHPTGALTYICGGSLVTDRHIITTAHCVTHERTNIVGDADSYLVHIGRTKRSQIQKQVQIRRLRDIIIFPEYNPHNYNNDLAILKLRKRVEFTTHVRPICLWNETDSVSVVGKEGVVVGFGLDENRNEVDELREIRMPVVDWTTCVLSNKDFFIRVTTNETYCAGYRNGVSACNGDSGGGMYFPYPVNAKNDDSRWQIRGMVSLSVAFMRQYCNPYNYVVFTDLKPFLPWIKKHLSFYLQ